jgi:hypothetical protein
MRHTLLSVLGLTLGLALVPRAALAGEATLRVGDPDRFAPPPPSAPVVIVAQPRPEPVYEAPPEEPPSPDPYRSPVRLGVGPVGATSGLGLGLGLGVTADFGKGTVGARISAAWLKGEEKGGRDSSSMPLGNGIGQYTGELVLDLNKRGPAHPLVGLGFGAVHVSRNEGSGFAGVGVARLGFEYALGLSDADVRIGGGVTGVLPGPMSPEAQGLTAYVLVTAGLTIGF